MKLKTLKEIAVSDALYLAGFFDGEGCVGIYRRSIENSGKGSVNPQFVLTMSIANTNFKVLSHIAKTIGGVISAPYRQDKAGNNRKKIWTWSARSRETFHILNAIFPFLIVKREQAALAIAYQYSILEYMNRPHPFHLGQLPLSKEEVERRNQFALRMRELKRQ